jgi:phosphoenolpyruvate carboxykinase (GTP)
VNWFRQNEAGQFLWPGFGENLRVLKWITERVKGTATAQETPIGIMPTRAGLDTTGLSLSEAALNELLAVDHDGWRAEAALLKTDFAAYGERVPPALNEQLAALIDRLG